MTNIIRGLSVGVLDAGEGVDVSVGGRINMGSWEVGPTRVLGDVLVDGIGLETVNYRLELVGSCFDLVESVIDSISIRTSRSLFPVMSSGSCFCRRWSI